MKFYSAALIGLAALLAGFGVLLAFAMLPWGLTLIVAFIGAAAAAAAHSKAQWSSARGLTVIRRTNALWVCSLGLVALAGLLAFSVPATATVALVLGICALPLIAAACSARATDGGRSHADADGPDVTARPIAPEWPMGIEDDQLCPDIGDWSVDDLCWAWRRSFTRLQRADAVGVVRLTRERQLYLDELERRYPREFRAWLSAGARAASDPSRFVCSRNRKSSH